jgi:hypothetical protein
MGVTLVNNKHLVEVDPTTSNALESSVLQLSPIDLKESNRDLSRKLDELYQSYELKEKQYDR